jgi:hypothetical protein
LTASQKSPPALCIFLSRTSTRSSASAATCMPTTRLRCAT